MNLFNIQAASQITGVSGACIRAWEKRYKSIVPTRNEMNHRFYSSQDIERISLLHKLTCLGLRIGHLSTLDTEELQSLERSVSQDQGKNPILEEAPDGNNQALSIIEKSFFANRLDVAYHEVAKVIAHNDLEDLSASFIPALQELCRSWKLNKTIDPDLIRAFELYGSMTCDQRLLSQYAGTNGSTNLIISITEDGSHLTSSALAFLLASHKLGVKRLTTSSNLTVLRSLVMVLNPKDIYIVAEQGSRHQTAVEEMLEGCKGVRLITLDYFASKSRTPSGKILQGPIRFTNLQEVHSLLKTRE